MAIVLPLLLLILFGIIDFGLGLNRQLNLTEAAREGARVAALNGSDANVAAKVESVFDPAGVLDVQPTVAVDGTCDPAGTAPGEVRVHVEVSYESFTGIGSMMEVFGQRNIKTFTLTADGVMSCVG